MNIKIFLLIVLTTIVIGGDIYIEDVLSCVKFDCEPLRSACGIDSDCRYPIISICRLSYQNFTSCISTHEEKEYKKCKTNGHIAWHDVMDCYTGCRYFEISNALVSVAVIIIFFIIY